MNRLYYISFRAMGCEVTIQLETTADGTAILNALPAQVERIEAQLSRFRPQSELMKLNTQAGEWVKVSDVLFDNIRVAKHAALLTEGLYNPLVLPAMIAHGYDRSFEQLTPTVMGKTSIIADWHSIELRHKSREVRLLADTALDLGGIAKGWTCQKLADDLAIHGACLVNMGGDMTAIGAPIGLDGWTVEIRDPFNGTVFATIFLRDETIATSGTDYRRWQTPDGNSQHHIIHPHTGQSAKTDAVSVTIIHKHAPTAESYAKAVLLQGANAGLKWLNKQWDATGLVFRQDGAVFSTSNFSQLMDQRITS